MNTAWVSPPSVTVSAAGSMVSVTGPIGVAVAVFDAALADVPSRARIWKLYAVPLARPVAVCETVAAVLPEMPVQPPQAKGEPDPRRYSYPSMSLSPGSAHASATCPSPAVAVRPVGAAGASGIGSVMENVARVVVPDAPPPRFVPELALSVPRSMSTVSSPVSAALSAVALRVSVTALADGPVKVTRGLLPWATLFRSWQATPVAVAQVVV